MRQNSYAVRVGGRVPHALLEPFAEADGLMGHPTVVMSGVVTGLVITPLASLGSALAAVRKTPRLTGRRNPSANPCNVGSITLNNNVDRVPRSNGTHGADLIGNNMNPS